MLYFFFIILCFFLLLIWFFGDNLCVGDFFIIVNKVMNKLVYIDDGKI